MLRTPRLTVVRIACAAVLLVPTAGLAQVLPSEPIVLAGGTIVVSGEVSAAIGSQDHPGYFNYTDYDHTPLRMFRAALTAGWYPASRVALLTELRTENLESFKAYALYLRVRPWPARAFDIQIGRIPPSFGAFSRRSYSIDNPLIGYPLAYQYLTTVRDDALPVNADNVLRLRGRGWLVTYPIGNPTPDGGVPLVSAFRWDTGVQVRVGARPIEATFALTTGTLSSPRVDDDNGGRQVSGRLAVYPTPGLVVGFSAARGPFVSDRATAALPAGTTGGTPTQLAFGADIEYSRDHWIVRSEVVVSAWNVPAVRAPFIEDRLTAAGVWVEGRYRLSPRIYLAGRVDHLGFSRITGTLFGGRPTSWDAPVTRAQIGAGYYVRRNIVARAEYQYNWRDGGRPRERGLASAQILYWF